MRELPPVQRGAEPHVDQTSGVPTKSMLPVATILLPLMVYANLWITDKIPGLDWFDRTFPRVLTTALLILYFAILWIAGPAPSRMRLRRVRLWRTVIALGLITVNVLVPIGLFIDDRLQRGPFPNNVIDWPLQIEQGSALVLQGWSPYGYDYSQTEMKLWSDRANFSNNPALRHAIHLPVNFILGAITQPLWRAATGWYDARIILIAAYLAVLLLAARLAEQWEDSHALMIGLALNPLLVDTFAVGLSDYLLLAWLVLALVLRRYRRPRAAAAMLGLAVATRQFAWLLVPLYLAGEWFALSGDVRTRLRQMVWRLWPLALFAAGPVIPFLVTNPRGFLDDVIRFGSGGMGDMYPMGGPGTYGLSAIVLGLGWVGNQNAQFPFTMIQLLTTLPLIAYGVWSQRRDNTLRHMLFSYLIVLSVFLFTGRFMHSNYIGYLFAIAMLAYFIGDTPLRDSHVDPPTVLEQITLTRLAPVARANTSGNIKGMRD